MSGRKKKHGLSNTKFYRAWVSMKCRCDRPETNGFSNYGGRGIKVCDRWSNFMNFYEDMYESFLAHIDLYGKKDTTLDRIDVNRNYEPSNCRWATYTEQIMNRREVVRENFVSPASKTYVVHEIIDGSEKLVVRNKTTGEIINVI